MEMIERAAATLGVRREAGKVFAAGRSAPPTIAAHQLQPKRRRDLSIHHLPGRRAEVWQGEIYLKDAMRLSNYRSRFGLLPEAAAPLRLPVNPVAREPAVGN